MEIIHANQIMPSGVYAELINHEHVFESMSHRAIVINDFDPNRPEENELLNRLLFTRYEGDTLESSPTCDCGALDGEIYRGVVCSICNTEVSVVTEREYEPQLWIRVPDGVHAFISPRVWTILNNLFKVNGVLMIRWLTDQSYIPKTASAKNAVKTKPIFKEIQELGWKRSINYFIDNFDTIINFLLENNEVIKVKKPVPRIRQWIEDNRDKFFTRYLPIPNRALFITEKINIGGGDLNYVDKVIGNAIDAVRTARAIDTGIVKTTQRVRENHAVKIVHQLATFYSEYIKKNLASKKGLFRHQVYGSRLDMSARAVITSISGPHDYRELHLPWGLACMLFKTHLTNKLLRKDMSPDEIEEFIMRHVYKYHPLLDELFHELINESPHELGIPVIFQRNPTLERGSAQQFFVPKVKTDPSNRTISMSPLCLKAPNADFDGDEMNLLVLPDMAMYRPFSRLAPSFGVMDTGEPGKMSGNIGIPGPIISTISSWMHEHD